MIIVIVILLTAVLSLVLFGALSHRKTQSLALRCSSVTADLASMKSQLKRYSGIVDLEAEVAAAKKKLEETKHAQQLSQSDSDQKRIKLGQEYEKASSKYKQLLTEVSLLEENLDDISFGLYKPHFTFQASEEYKTALERLRHQERRLLRDDKAAVCSTQWTVKDDKKAGARMVKENKKLLLRAFNGECDAAVANVSWNNVAKMEERIRKALEAVNKLGETLTTSITTEFLELRLNEIRLAHEYEDKRNQEREEQRSIKEKIREEEKVQREFEKAQEEAEVEEETYQKLLERARKEAAEATGAHLQGLTQQVASFEAKLDEARRKKERAISRAQLTKSGFVYVISNIGAFGHDVYKIGMTRRLEPAERILELSGAAVPFPFDLHAMLYTDNAPALELGLRQLLEARRLNLVNPRKEFYQHVKLEEIEAYVKTKGLSAQFVEYPEAKEYRETLAKRERGSRPTPMATFLDSPLGAREDAVLAR